MSRWGTGIGAAPDRYEITAPLGGGGSAELFHVRSRGGNSRQAVLKCLRPAKQRRASALAREAAILGSIDHPNVVRLLDMTEHDGRQALVLEYLDGPSTAQLLALLGKTRLPVPVAVAAYIARELCRALDLVHSLGFVHRDVSPENVMTTTTGEVKLIDFGIAIRSRARRARPRRSVTLFGKPAYMAPEQVLDVGVDGRADLFAAGALLYEMLTLERVFAAENDEETIRCIFDRKVEAPSRQRPSVPPELDAVVLTALERAPRRRYQTAAAMAEALDTIVRASDVGALEVAAFANLYRRMVSRGRSSPIRLAA
jgi:serine/threonine protein kinase